MHTPYPPRREGGGVELRLSPSRLELVFFRSGARFGHDYERWACFFLRLWGNKPGQFRVVIPMARNNTADAQRAGHVRGPVLASAQIIQFAPYLARKQERLLASQLHHSPIFERDIRACVAAMIEWSARY